MKGLLKAAMDAGAEVTMKRKPKPSVQIAKPTKTGRSLDAYSPPRKRKTVKDKVTPRKKKDIRVKRKNETLRMYAGKG